MRRRQLIVVAWVLAACGARSGIESSATEQPAEPEPTLPRDEPEPVEPEPAEPDPIEPDPCAGSVAPGELAWTQVIDLEGDVGVTSDAAGNAFVQICAPHGENDLFRFDVQGEQLWALSLIPQVRLNVDPMVRSTNSRGDSVLVAWTVAERFQRPVAAKIDRSGRLSWEKGLTRVPTSKWDPVSVSVDASGNSLVVGVAEEPVDFGGGPLGTTQRATFIVKLDEQGNHVWSEGLGGLIDSAKVVFLPDGSALLAGVAMNAFRLGGVELVSDTGAPFIAKLAANGSPVFVRMLTANESSTLYSLVAADDGSSYLALAFSGDLELAGQKLHTDEARTRAIIKFDRQGEWLWSRVLGANVRDVSLAISGQQQLVVAASFRQQITVDNRALDGGSFASFAAKLGDAGQLLWLRQWPGSEEALPSVASDDCGSVLVTGRFSRTYDTGRELYERSVPPAGVNIVRYSEPGYSAAVVMRFAPTAPAR